LILIKEALANGIKVIVFDPHGTLANRLEYHPLGEANRGSGIAKKGYEGIYGKDERLKDRCDRPLSEDKNNIGNFRYGRNHTIKLCQLAGFDVHDIIVNKMYFPSFWMLNLAKKSQRKENKGAGKFHALKAHEYVLVFRKPIEKVKCEKQRSR